MKTWQEKQLEMLPRLGQRGQEIRAELRIIRRLKKQISNPVGWWGQFWGDLWAVAA
jgi:hypothetical protein